LKVVPKPKPDPRTVWSVDFEFPNGEREHRDGFHSYTEEQARRYIENYWNSDERGKPRIISIKPWSQHSK